MGRMRTRPKRPSSGASAPTPYWPDATALVVTSNGIARFLPDVVGRTPADLDRKLKTGAWGTVQISGAETCILDWNVRP